MLKMQLAESGQSDWQQHTSPRRQHKTIIHKHHDGLVLQADAYVSYYTAFYTTKISMSYTLNGWFQGRPFQLKHADPAWMFPITTSLQQRRDFIAFAMIVLDMQMAADLQKYCTGNSLSELDNYASTHLGQNLTTCMESVFSHCRNLRLL